MQAFHSNTKHWPYVENPINKGESPLQMTMSQFFLAVVWLQTYTWMVKLVTPLPSRDNPTEGNTIRTPLSSQANWNHQSEPNRQPCLHRGKASVQPEEKITTKLKQSVLGNTESWKQWDQMRQFYEKIPTWLPAMEQNSSKMGGGWPLVWSMQHGYKPIAGMGIWKISCLGTTHSAQLSKHH